MRVKENRLSFEGEAEGIVTAAIYCIVIVGLRLLICVILCRYFPVLQGEDIEF